MLRNESSPAAGSGAPGLSGTPVPLRHARPVGTSRARA